MTKNLQSSPRGSSYILGYSRLSIVAILLHSGIVMVLVPRTTPSM